MTFNWNIDIGQLISLLAAIGAVALFLVKQGKNDGHWEERITRFEKDGKDRYDRITTDMEKLASEIRSADISRTQERLKQIDDALLYGSNWRHDVANKAFADIQSRLITVEVRLAMTEAKMQVMENQLNFIRPVVK